MQHLIDRPASTKKKTKRPPSGKVKRSDSLKKLRIIQDSGQNEEFQSILKTVRSIEQDLKMRISMYGPESPSTIECLQHFVKTSNDYALYMIKFGHFRMAMELLLECEEMLNSGAIGHFPQHKFQTFNNIAHCHNVQGNVRLSLKYLIKSLEFGSDAQSVSNEGQLQVPLVETLINISNAYQFLGNLDKALEYAELSSNESQRIVQVLMEMLEQVQPTGKNEQENAHYSELQKSYHQQVQLQAMSFQVKGQLFEKAKEYDEAMHAYNQGKQVIESNYGTQHKLYMEFVNAINGAKLRTKYLQHSNAGAPQQIQNNQGIDFYGQEEQKHNHSRVVGLEQRHNEDIVSNSLNIVRDDQNLFLREMEKIKPISQQQKKKVVRPSSASYKDSLKTKKNILENSLTSHKSSKHFLEPMASVKRVPWPSGISPQYSTRSSSNSKKNRSLMQQSPSTKQSLRVRKNKMRIAQGVLMTDDGKKVTHPYYGTKMGGISDLNTSHGSLSQQCHDCHNQIDELKKMNQQQNEMLSQLMRNQQLQTSQMSHASNSQSSLFPQALPPGQTQQQYPPPPPYYYPPYPYYPPPPYYMYPPPTQNSTQTPYNQSFQSSKSGMPPNMNQMPPHPYGYYPPGPPMFNNFGVGVSGQHSQSQTPDKEFDNMVKHNQELAWDQFRNAQNREQQQNQFSAENRYEQNNLLTEHTDFDRDSQFNDLNSNRAQQQSKQPNRVSDNYQQRGALIEINDQEKLRLSKNKKQEQQVKENTQGIVNIEVQLNETQPAYKKQVEAAIRIQSNFRRFRLQKLFQEYISQSNTFEKFYRAVYVMKDQKKKTKKVFLNGSLVLIRKIPSHVQFTLYDQQSKQTPFQLSVKLETFGIKDKKSFKRQAFFNQMKAYLTEMRGTGNIQADITEVLKQFKEVKPIKHKINMQEIKEQLYKVESQLNKKQAEEVMMRTNKQEHQEQEYEIQDEVSEEIRDEYEEYDESMGKKDFQSHSSSIHKSGGGKQVDLNKGSVPNNESNQTATFSKDQQMRKSTENGRQGQIVQEQSPQNEYDDQEEQFQEESVNEQYDDDQDQNQQEQQYDEEEDDMQIIPMDLIKAHCAMTIQRHVRGFLARNSMNLYIFKLQKQLLCALLLKQKNQIFYVRVNQLIDYENQCYYYLISVANRNNKMCPLFQKELDELPIQTEFLKEYIANAMSIEYDSKKNVIKDFVFKQYQQQTLTIEHNDYQLVPAAGQQIPVPVQQQQNQLIQQNDSIQVEQAKDVVQNAVIKIQSNMRGFLARQQVNYMSDNKIICQTVLIDNRHVCKIIAKRVVKKMNKDKSMKEQLAKVKLIVVNITNTNQKPLKMEIEKFPVDSPYIKEYIEQGIEVKWSFFNSKIEKISFNDMNAGVLKLIHKINMNEHQEQAIQQVKEDFKELKEEVKKQQIETQKQQQQERPIAQPIQAPIQAPVKIQSQLNPQKEPNNESAIIKIQSNMRGFLARQQVKYMSANKVICQTILIENRHVCKVTAKRVVTKMNKDKSMKEQLAKVKLTVANVTNTNQKPLKMEIEKFPVDRPYIKEYIEQGMEIKWSFFNSKIEKISFNDKNAGVLKLIHKINMNEHQEQAIQQVKEDFKELKEEVKHQQTDAQSKPVVNQQAQVVTQPSPQVVPPVPQAKEQVKQKETKVVKKEDKEILTKEQFLSLSKVQARVRGMIDRKSPIFDQIGGFTMMMRTCRKLSDQKYYTIFLMQKDIKALTSVNDELYLITLRQAQNINEIYELKIDVAMARKLFKREGISKQDQNQLIQYKYNKEEFIKLLLSLDVNMNEEFALDQEKFKRLKSEGLKELALKEQNPEIDLLEIAQSQQMQSVPFSALNSSSNQVKVNSRQIEEDKTRGDDKSRSSPPKQKFDQSAQEVDDEEIDDNVDYGDEEYYDDDQVIEEADSRYEVSPQPNTRGHSQATSQQKSPFIASQLKSQATQQSPNQPPQQRIDTNTLRMIVDIQRHIRGFLARKRAHLEHEKVFMAKHASTKNLVFYEQSMLRLCNLYFMQFIYQDKSSPDIKYTLREMSQKVTIVKLKDFSPSDFSREDVDIDEIICAIEETLMEYEEQILMDARTHDLHEQWPLILRKFIDDDNKLMKLMRNKIEIGTLE